MQRLLGREWHVEDIEQGNESRVHFVAAPSGFPHGGDEAEVADAFAVQLLPPVVQIPFLQQQLQQGDRLLRAVFIHLDCFQDKTENGHLRMQNPAVALLAVPSPRLSQSTLGVVSQGFSKCVIICSFGTFKNLSPSLDREFPEGREGTQHRSHGRHSVNALIGWMMDG